MKHWQCGRFSLPLGEKTYIMGIVNATPDSFSGDGVFDLPAALQHALQLAADGADILDIGGESTRPGAAPVDEDEELRRVVPLVEELVGHIEIPISVDTTKAAVARAALEAGASIINDISAALHDEAMRDVWSNSNCGIVLMHRRGTSQNMQPSSKYAIDDCVLNFDVIAEVRAYFEERTAKMRTAGIEKKRLCLDGGFGFGKSLDENLELLRRGREISALGYPTLSATSRKSTIGKLLGDALRGDAPVDGRAFGTAATVALAIANGCDIVRVHDVNEMAQVARVADAVVRGSVSI